MLYPSTVKILNYLHIILLYRFLHCRFHLESLAGSDSQVLDGGAVVEVYATVAVVAAGLDGVHVVDLDGVRRVGPSQSGRRLSSDLRPKKRVLALAC